MRQQKCCVTWTNKWKRGQMMVSTLWNKLYSKYEYEIRYHPGKANVVTNALSRKERVKPRRVQAMAMTIQFEVRGMILAAQSEAFKQENGMMRTVVMDEAHASRSPVLWAEIGESSLTGPELVLDMTDKVVLIKEKLKAARDHQKSYVDNRRKPLEFKGKLAPSLHVPLDEIKVDKTLRFVKEPVENSDHEVKRAVMLLCVPFYGQAKLLAVRYLVKVSWNSKGNFELIWVWEDYLKDKYPRSIIWLVVPDIH
ncbi:hypothetical protein Tco_1576354 [Tanacetum coccineum]